MVKKDDREVVVTLYEGHYHLGVAALVNSLFKGDFSGTFVVGHRGALPSWTEQLQREGDAVFSVFGKFTITFTPVDPPMHFGYYKPFFLKRLLSENSGIEKIFYFDPDIVVNAPWSFLSTWVESGISLCLDDCYHFVHRNHPWRKEWIKFADIESNFECIADYYVNSGFIGLCRADEEILDKWIWLTEMYGNKEGDLSLFEKAGHRAFKGDQDLLNAAITISPDLKYSFIGKEGMGFSQPAYLMSHAVSAVKPWKKNFINYLFRFGESPSLLDKHYFKHANAPISAYSKFNFNIKKIDLLMASIIGRLIG